MRARELTRAVGVVAVVAVVVVAAAFAGGLVLGSPAQSDAPAAPAYDTNELVAEPVEDGGSVTAPAGDESKTIVVDVSHGNDVSEDALQPLVDALVAADHEVRVYGGGSSSGFNSQPGAAFNETLRGADALVVASPATTYSSNEVAGVEAFADAGGRVLLAAEPPTTTSTTSTVSIPGLTSSGSVSAAGQPANLAAAFGVSFGNGYLYDMAENANNFQSVYAAGDGGVADGVGNAILTDATPVTTGGDASSVLTASDVSLSSTREEASYSVAARNGNVLAVGDIDFLTSSTATEGDNDVLLSNVAAFLVGGDKEAGAPASPSGSAGGQNGTGSPVVTA
ncbi:GldG family protein [Halobacterium noricense]|uniref:GldG family protein n=1 Tax=Halobacterium noricense TaxID=223182 RepID=UPI001E3901B8|nr:GldG family protein [Halobacterium noricense]UHH26013.1 GldG family protein [Halobacterium noricense]